MTPEQKAALEVAHELLSDQDGHEGFAYEIRAMLLEADAPKVEHAEAVQRIIDEIEAMSAEARAADYFMLAERFDYLADKLAGVIRMLEEGAKP
jgi:hypothetical protein